MPVSSQGMPMGAVMAKEVTYKYKWRFLPAAWLLVFGPFCIFLGVAWVSRQGWQGGILFLLISLTFVTLIGWLLIIGLANISIDNEGISRKIFGVTWQKMKWIDMVRLHISNSLNPENGRTTRSYVLVASKGHARFFSKRITFQERKEGMTELLSKMNYCITQHGIRVVDKSLP
jgi:hypothetical protein